MAESIALYRRLVGSRIRSQSHYRFSFALSIVGNGVLTALDILNIVVFFHHIDRLGGWTLPEVAFLYGTSYVGHRIGDMLIGQIEQLPIYIREGTFDSFLIRPLGALFQVATSEFSLRHLGGVTQGLIVFGWAIATVTVDWSPARVVMVGVMMVVSLVMFMAIWVITNSIAFWFVDTREIANSFTYGGNFVSQYPMHIFGAWMRRFFTVVIPIAFINYFPALYVLDKPVLFGAPAFRFLSPVVAVVTVLAARAVWRAGLRRYQGTGS